MMTLRDYEHDLYFSNREGFEKGVAKGRVEGEAIGVERTKKETAKSMKSEGIPTDVIVIGLVF